METDAILLDTLRDLKEVRENTRAIVAAVQDEHYHRLSVLSYVLLESITEAERSIQLRLERPEGQRGG